MIQPFGRNTSTPQTGRDRQTDKLSTGDKNIGEPFWATVCKMVGPMLSDRCPVCLPHCMSVCTVLSVTLVYYGQTVGWIKMKLSVQVGLAPGYIVLDGDTAPPPQKGRRPPIFGPCPLWPNGWMDRYNTWYGGRPQPRRPCGVRWGLSPIPEKGTEPPPQFLTHLYCGQTAGCTKMPLGMELGLSAGDFVLDGDSAPLPKRGAEPR